MTLTQAQRVPLARAIANLRHDWHLAGIDAALVKLSQQVTDPFVVARIAVEAAADARNRTPAVMCQPRAEAPMPSSSLRSSDGRSGACPTHGGTSRRGAGGPFACCWTAGLERPGVETERRTERNEESA